MGVAKKNNISLRDRFAAVRYNEDAEILKSLEDYIGRTLNTLENTILYHLDAVETQKSSIHDDAMRYVHITPGDKRATVDHLSQTEAFRKLHEFCADPSRNLKISFENYSKDGKAAGVRATIDLSDEYCNSPFPISQKPKYTVHKGGARP